MEPRPLNPVRKKKNNENDRMRFPMPVPSPAWQMMLRHEKTAQKKSRHLTGLEPAVRATRRNVPKARSARDQPANPPFELQQLATLLLHRG